MDTVLVLTNFLIMMTLFSVACGTDGIVAESSPRRLVNVRKSYRYPSYKRRQPSERKIFDVKSQFWNNQLQTMDPRIDTLMRRNAHLINTVHRFEAKFDRFLDRIDFEECGAHGAMMKFNQIHQSIRGPSQNTFRADDCESANEMPQHNLLIELVAAVGYSNENIRKLVSNIDMVLASDRRSLQLLQKIAETVQDIDQRTIRIQDETPRQTPGEIDIRSENPMSVTARYNVESNSNPSNERTRHFSNGRREHTATQTLNYDSPTIGTFNRNKNPDGQAATIPIFESNGSEDIHWNRNYPVNEDLNGNVGHGLRTNSDPNEKTLIDIRSTRIDPSTPQSANVHGGNPVLTSAEPNYESSPNVIQNRNSFTISTEERAQKVNIGHNHGAHSERENKRKESDVINHHSRLDVTSFEENHESSGKEVDNFNRNSHKANEELRENKNIDHHNRRAHVVTHTNHGSDKEIFDRNKKFNEESEKFNNKANDETENRNLNHNRDKEHEESENIDSNKTIKTTSTRHHYRSGESEVHNWNGNSHPSEVIKANKSPGNGESDIFDRNPEPIQSSPNVIQNRNSFTISTEERAQKVNIGHTHGAHSERENKHKESDVLNHNRALNVTSSKENHESSGKEVHNFYRNSHKTNEELKEKKNFDDNVLTQTNHSSDKDKKFNEEPEKSTSRSSGTVVHKKANEELPDSKNGSNSHIVITGTQKNHHSNESDGTDDRKLTSVVSPSITNDESNGNHFSKPKENTNLNHNRVVENVTTTNNISEDNANVDRNKDTIVTSAKTEFVTSRKNDSQTHSSGTNEKSDRNETVALAASNQLQNTTNGLGEQNSGNNGNATKIVTRKITTTTTTTTTTKVKSKKQKTYRSLRKDTKRVTFEADKRNCHDLKTKRNGIYKFASLDEVANDADRFFYERYCDFNTDDTAWTVIQRRFADYNQESFNRTWSDFKLGFGKLDDEFWFGNDFIHKLTHDDDVELRIILGENDGKPDWVQYSTFQMKSELDNYKLVIGGYSGNVADSFLYHNDQDFSTFDGRNATTEFQCAATIGNGWWFKNCTDGVLGNWLGSKATKMMIRPKNAKSKKN